jgi:hypothetical protein
VRNVRDALFRNITEQGLEYFNATATGVLISRISQGVVYVLDTYVDKLNNCVQFAAQMIARLVMSFCLTWQVILVGRAGRSNIIEWMAATWDRIEPTLREIAQESGLIE